MTLFIISSIIIIGFLIWLGGANGEPEFLFLYSLFPVLFLGFSSAVSNEKPISESDPIYLEYSEEGIEVLDGQYVVYDNSSGIREPKLFSPENVEIIKEDHPSVFLIEVEFDHKDYWYRFNFVPENYFKLYIPENLAKFKVITNEKPNQ